MGSSSKSYKWGERLLPPPRFPQIHFLGRLTLVHGVNKVADNEDQTRENTRSDKKTPGKYF